MTKLLPVLLLTATAAFVQAQDCSELFISEYVVGDGNNRALELYNPTNGPIDLGLYQVGRFRDGAGTPMLLPLAGTIASKGVYVVVIDKRDPNGTGLEAPIDAALEAVGDTFVNPVYAQANSPFYFNGDDAVPLIKGTTELKDLVGKIGEDPGTAWPLGGAWWTNEHTLVRKASVKQGVTVNPSEFIPATEWDSLANNTFTSLGWHDCECNTTGVNNHGATQINLYPNPAADKVLMLSASGSINKIDVFSSLGQRVAEVKFGQVGVREHRLDLNQLPSGIYMVHVEMVDGTVVTRRAMLGK